MTEIRPAPKHLAMLAAEMREDWPYDDTRAALIACSTAGWATERIYRETFLLLLKPDSGPGDLRAAARGPIDRRPLKVVADPEEQARAAAYSREKADEARAQLTGHAPEGDEVA